MDLLKLKIKDSFSGIMAVSDIHGVWKSTADLSAYAKKNNLFIVFLGDIVDGDKDSALVVDKVLFDWVYKDRAAFVIGNHEDKYHRAALGNKVQMGYIQEKTLAEAEQEYNDSDAFTERILRLVTHPRTDYAHTYGSWVFTHGAAHASIWDTNVFPTVLSKVQTVRALYGEVDGTREPLKFSAKLTNAINKVASMVTGAEYAVLAGFPKRTYRWCHEVPAGRKVVVGHDRRPMDKLAFNAQPLLFTNDKGGQVMFTDTGSGKNVGGYVTGAVFRFNGDDLVFDKFKRFGN